MAKNKIQRIDLEIQKTREKIAEQQEKLKAENLEIVQMVRALRMTPEQLSTLLTDGSTPKEAATMGDEQEGRPYEG